MASITAVSTNAASAASPTFSVTSPVRLISPRTSRPNAFSSRSSASMPAASSSATNIIEPTTAASAANALSDELEPETTIRLTCTGLLIEARIGFERSRLSAARPAKRETCSSATRSGASSGSPRDRGLDDRAARCAGRGCRRRRRAAARPSPPATITLRYLARLLEHLGGDRGVGLGERRVDRVLDVLRLQRVLGAVVDLDRRPPAAAQPERALELARSRRPGPRARRAPRRTSPSRSPPRAC